MADKHWKAEERKAAAILGGKRHPANVGGEIDVTSGFAVAQCKNVKRLSLNQIESLAQRIHEIGVEQGKVGVLILKRRGGSGQRTPRLLVLTEEAWKRMAGKGNDEIS